MPPICGKGLGRPVHLHLAALLNLPRFLRVGVHQSAHLHHQVYRRQLRLVLRLRRLFLLLYHSALVPA